MHYHLPSKYKKGPEKDSFIKVVYLNIQHPDLFKAIYSPTILERCLESIQDIPDKIIIVDTVRRIGQKKSHRNGLLMFLTTNG